MGTPVQDGYSTSDDVTFDVNFSLDKLISGIETLEQISPAVEEGVRLGIQELGERLEKKMIEYLIEYGLGDSPIIGTINLVTYEDGISLTVGQDYAIYVEYGTGLAGSKNPHPKPEGWQYMIGEQSSLGGGWWYPTTLNDPNPIKWNSNKGLYAWTHEGLPSRPFMYKTWLWGTRSATQIIRKNIRNEVKKIKGAK